MSSTDLMRNPRLLCAFHGVSMSLFPVAVITIFWKYELGFSMTQIMGIQAIFGGVVALFEFPSGYVADRLGYRRTLLAGVLFALAGWVVYCVANDFWSVVAADVFLGIGLSLTSGADTALLYESVVETGREEQFARWFGRYRFFGQGAEGSAALLAGVLYAIWPRLPLVLMVGACALNLGIAAALVEPRRHPSLELGHWERVRWIVRFALRESARLRAVIALTTVLGLTSFAPVWLIALYAESAGVPVVWIGPLWAIANYVVAATALASDRIRSWIGLMPTLLLSIALAAGGYLGLGLSSALFGFAFYFLITASRGLFGTVLHHEEQRLIPSGDRASFLSLRNLIFRGSFLFVGPAIGAAVDAYGMHPVLLALGATATAASLASWIWLARTDEVTAPAAVQ